MKTSSGFSLMEVLFSLLIISIGMLSLEIAQLKANQLLQVAYQRFMEHIQWSNQQEEKIMRN